MPKKTRAEKIADANRILLKHLPEVVRFLKKAGVIPKEEE